ncbi:MAG: hypothetical protein ACI8RD_010449 [Bacillariaceae sp.]|jgi:hypothetical protein
MHTRTRTHVPCRNCVSAQQEKRFPIIGDVVVVVIQNYNLMYNANHFKKCIFF